MTLTLEPKRAIITGASSGIGRATALAFAEAGIAVALVSRSQSKLEAVTKAICDFGGEARSYPTDLAQLPEVEERMAAIAADFGPIDILVNCAGMGYTNSLAETSLADWQQVVDLNLLSIVQCVAGILPGMRDRRSGTIINVASIAARTAFPQWGAYCTSKAALVAFSQVLAVEERANGIRVTSILPGAVNTPIWDTETVRADFERAAMLSPDTVAQAILHAAQLPAEAVIEETILMPSAGAL